MGADNARDRVFIGNGKARQPHLGGTRNQLLGVGGPVEEGEIGQGREFDERHVAAWVDWNIT